MLHSAFWTHGAGSLDLPPFVAGRSLPHSYPVSSEGLSLQDASGDSTEAPFLDFLYPPQAVETFRRRVMYGSVSKSGKIRPTKGSRRYSSRSDNRPNWRPQLMSKLGSRGVAPTNAKSFAQSMSAAMVEPAEERPVEEWRCEVATSDTIPHASSIPATRAQQLLDLLKHTSENVLEFSRTIDLYDSLSMKEKSIDVTREILIWLASVGSSETTRNWEIRMLETMPKAADLPDSCWHKDYCRAAIVIHVRHGNYDEINAIIDGCINRRVMGDFGQRAAMEHFLQEKHFHKASDLFQSMRRYVDLGGRPSAIRSLFKYRELSMLRDDVIKLYQFTLENSTAANFEGLRELRARVLTEFVSRSLSGDTYHSFRAAFSGILAILKFLRREQQNDPMVFEPLIQQMLLQEPSFDKAQYCRLVADAWDTYSRGEKFRPSNALMLKVWEAMYRDKLLDPIPATKSRPAMSSDSISAVWKKIHPRLGYAALNWLTKIAADKGDVDKVEHWTRVYVDERPAERVETAFFWPYIRVHGVRRDAEGALAAFKRLRSEFNVVPDMMCWNMLLWSYFRSDNLEGALRAFRAQNEVGVSYGAASVHVMMTLYSKLGNPAGVAALMAIAKAENLPTNTHFKMAELLAHTNSGQVTEAMNVLEKSVKDHKGGLLVGSMTKVYNVAMETWARRGDYSETVALYQRMKENNVPLDSDSYGSIIKALCMRRNPHEAWWTIRKVMPADKIQATPQQYATIMNAMGRIRDYKMALKVWDHMLAANISPTTGAYAVYIRAKALLEDAETRIVRDSEDTEPTLQRYEPLHETTKELLKILDKDPVFSARYDFTEPHLPGPDMKSNLFESLIQLHGKRQCFDTAQELFLLYHKHRGIESSKSLPETTPFRLATAMMSVYQRTGQHEEVLKYWELLLKQAEDMQYLPSVEDAMAGLKQPMVQPSARSTISGNDQSKIASIDRSRLAGARRYILSRPFQYYSTSILTQPNLSADTTVQLIRTAIGLLSSGWLFDNFAWNMLVQRLCAAKPSRAMIAFSLTERFLIPNFPGWKYPRQILTQVHGMPNPSRRAEQTQYFDMTPRPINHDERLPHYNTMVWLAYALLEVRRAQAVGVPGANKETMTQVGTLEDIEKRAPKTLEHVRNLPIVLDRIQKQLIRKGNDFEHGGRWYGQA